MGCLTSGVFWGVLIIIIGILILIRVIFGINIPIFSLIIGLLLIYLGIRIISGATCCRRPKTIIFEERNIEGTPAENKYDVVFGKSLIDLSGIELKSGVTKVDINIVFGSATIKVNPSQPIKIRASSVFGSARLPDGNMTAFGDYTYKTDALKQTDTKDYLLIKMDVVFGNAEVVTK
ncbi:MAG: LiaF domain-containing protein [candidate division WOR-3 bacterium]